jgi:hypothetical protein
MTSKTSSPKIDPLVGAIEDVFTTRHFIDDDLGSTSVNVVDALYAIANAIHHLATVQEKAQERFDRDIERRQRIADQIREATEEVSDDFPRGPKGHA